MTGQRASDEWVEVEVTRAFTALHGLARFLYNQQRWAEGHHCVAVARELCEFFDLDPGDEQGRATDKAASRAR